MLSPTKATVSPDFKTGDEILSAAKADAETADMASAKMNFFMVGNIKHERI